MTAPLREPEMPTPSHTSPGRTSVDSATVSVYCNDVPTNPNAIQRNEAASGKAKISNATFFVTVPPNVRPGMAFNVSARGQKIKVICPPNAGPNSKIRIVVPSAAPGPDELQKLAPCAAPKIQVYEMTIPQGVGPNKPFTLTVNNQRVLINCPPNAHAGQKIRFQLRIPDLPLANTA